MAEQDFRYKVKGSDETRFSLEVPECRRWFYFHCPMLQAVINYWKERLMLKLTEEELEAKACIKAEDIFTLEEIYQQMSQNKYLAMYKRANKSFLRPFKF